jgi:hypothetical protein
MDIREDTATVQVRSIPLAAMFTALGVMLPQVFHWFGLGSTFLPMFLPVLAAAMLLPRTFACIVAILTPLVSFMLTGMPPLSPPILPLMIPELTAAAFVASTIRVRYGRSVLLALAAALLVGRILLFVMVHVATGLAGVQHPLFGPALVLAGIPGIILMFVVIPPTIVLISLRFPRLAAVSTRRQ